MMHMLLAVSELERRRSEREGGGREESERTNPYSFFSSFIQFEADRRAFIITINSFGTELTQDDREKLYPTCGKLYPDGLNRLARCEDYEGVKGVAESYPVRYMPLIPFPRGLMEIFSKGPNAVCFCWALCPLPSSIASFHIFVYYYFLIGIC